MENQERKLIQSVKNLKKALDKLEEALQEDLKNSLIVDGTIQRFEFTIELYWKTLKRVLLSEGIITNTPKETLKEAFHVGWLDSEEAWLQMLRDRNLTSHTYDEKVALQIVHNIKDYFPEMKATFHKINSKISGSDE